MGGKSTTGLQYLVNPLGRTSGTGTDGCESYVLITLECFSLSHSLRIRLVLSKCSYN